MKNLVRRIETVPLTDSLRQEAVRQAERKTKLPAEKSKSCRTLDAGAATKRRSQLVREGSDDANLQLDMTTGKASLHKRVLVLDNDRIIADTLTTILRNAGHKVCVCYDESCALSRCESFHPDLMITDVIMPGINGIQLAIQVRQRYPACKVLLFSGQACSAKLVEDAHQNGYDFDILEKAVHPAVLLQKIAK